MDDIETIIRNSYKDFHTKGLDYLCLRRRDGYTKKVYFFEGNLIDLPEIVIPHNHRYKFTTTVLSGVVANLVYDRGPNGDRVYDRFDYMTPLNGGDGFTWSGEERLSNVATNLYKRGEHYRSSSNSIHTLDIRTDQTVIVLEQYADVVPLDRPTQAWRLSGSHEPPSLLGLYDKMTADEALTRIAQYRSLSPLV